MDLYLIRHADAAPLGEGGVAVDAERPLTAAGEGQAKLVAVGLVRKSVHVGVVLTSPLLRAQQTADGIVKAWTGPAPEVQICDELAPSGKRKMLTRVLRSLGSDAVALVGHQPDLGELAGWLIGSRKANVDFAKAGVAYIACDDPPGKGAGRLVWLVTPEWF